MIERAIQDITEADLQALVDRSQPEGRQLDFKAALPGGGDSDVREFLADITSFANSEGGDVIFGIAEDGNGQANALPGIASDGLDQVILGIEERVRTTIDLRLPAFHIHPVPLANGNAALVLRIPASLIAPHRAVYRGISRFHARNSRGKFEMDTSELRAAFAASDGLPRQLRALHDEALARAAGADMPCVLESAPRLVLTVAPISILRERRALAITRDNAVLPPDLAGGIYMVTGLDGLVVHGQAGDDKRIARAWSFNYRQGYLDFAWTIGGVRNDRKVIWRGKVEDALPGTIRSSIARLHNHGIEGPWVAMATLAGIEGHAVVTGEGYLSDLPWQDSAYLGQIIDERLDDASLQPFIEGFWRVFGYDRIPPKPAR
jgi:hypothetical protein